MYRTYLLSQLLQFFIQFSSLSKQVDITPGGVFGGSEQVEERRRIYLTPAQVALQEQLKSKHSELSRRIALQQAELIRWSHYTLSSWLANI